MRRLLALLLAFASVPAWASYSCDGANDRLVGTFGTTYGLPFSMLAYVKIADHPEAADVLVNVGAGGGSQSSSIKIGTAATADGWNAQSVNSVGTSVGAGHTLGIDGVWTPILVEFASLTSRTIYVGATTQTTNNTTSNDPGSAWDEIRLCENLAGTGDFAGLAAEIAGWDAVLSAGDKEALLDDRVLPSTIAASDLIFYYPLDADNSTQANEGLDTGGDLAVTGAVFNADHPTFAGAADPDWDTPPSVQSQDDTEYIVQYDANADADDIFCGRWPLGATPPADGAAVEAGTGALEAPVTEATTGASDTISVPATETPAFPASGVYCVLRADTGEYSAVADGDMLNEFLDPPTGKLFQPLASVHANSPCFGATPEVVAGDILVIDDRARTVAETPDPTGYVVTPFNTCLFLIASGGDLSRRFVEVNVYGVGLEDYHGAIIDDINNQPPFLIPEAFFENALYELGVNPDVDLAAQSGDPEGDDIDFPVTSGALATDWVQNDETGAITGGIPGACGPYTFEHTLTDTYGATKVVPGTVIIGPRVPEVANSDAAAAEAAIEGTGAAQGCTLTATAGTPAYSATVAEGNVISTDPAAGTLVVPDQAVTYQLSLGESPGGQRRKLNLGLGIDMSVLFEPTNAINDDYWDTKIAA